MQSILFCACAIDLVFLAFLSSVLFIKREALPVCLKAGKKLLICAAAVPAVFCLFQILLDLPSFTVPLALAFGELFLIRLLFIVEPCHSCEQSDILAFSDLADHQKTLEYKVQDQDSTIQKMQMQMIENFADIIELRDVVTGGHIKRSSQYVRMLIDELIRENVFPQLNDPRYAEHICLSAPLHDIGKIAIPDSILHKTTAYTPEEFEIMKSHTWLGGKLLDKTMSSMEDQAYYWLTRNIAVYHHEKWDGTGYPKKLCGNDIPLCARIMAVADVFDALTSKRPYRQPLNFDEAFRMIENESGKQFDPRIVAAFLRIKDPVIKFAVEYHMEQAS